MRAARLALVAFLVALPPVHAAGDVEYVAASGTMALGVAAVGVEGANLARWTFAPDASHHRLAVTLSFNGSSLDAEAGPAGVAVRNAFQADLVNATTGALLPGGALRFDSPGTLTYDLAGDAPVRLDLYLLNGANVAYDLRVAGEPDPTP